MRLTPLSSGSASTGDQGLSPADAERRVDNSIANAKTALTRSRLTTTLLALSLSNTTSSSRLSYSPAVSRSAAGARVNAVRPPNLRVKGIAHFVIARAWNANALVIGDRERDFDQMHVVRGRGIEAINGASAIFAKVRGVVVTSAAAIED